MVKIKVCGITNQEDALKAVYYGAWALGFVFCKKSPRYISPSRAKKIIEALPPFVTPVGVFVNHNVRAVKDVCQFAGIQTIQLHGDEQPIDCHRLRDYKLIKAFRVSNTFDFSEIGKYRVSAYLFDTYVENQEGGTGQSFNWDVLKDKKFDRPFILAGGLNVENIRQAIDTVVPFAVDVSSGLEKAPGIKDHGRIREFFLALK